MNSTEIKILMIRAGVKQISIAKKLGVSDAYVNQTIKGIRNSARIKRAIARALKQPMEELWPEQHHKRKAA